jgi:hypothetical protein
LGQLGGVAEAAGAERAGLKRGSDVAAGRVLTGAGHTPSVILVSDCDGVRSPCPTRRRIDT